MRAFAVVVLLTSAILLVGCNTLPEIPYDRSGAGNIKTIGIITPSFPGEPVVVLASTIGQSLGLVGALADAAMRSNREASFTSMLRERNFSAQDTFVQSLIAGLEAQGYSATVIPIKRDNAEFATRYPKNAEPKVDAYLDLVTVVYGYYAAGIRGSTPYRPVFAVRARLVRATDSSVLMQEQVIYNPLNPNAKVGVTIAPDPQYQFRNFDTLMADPDKAVQGLQGAIAKSTEMVTALLK